MSDETMSDDEVICRVPVYLSQDLASSLYLAQYPLRPAERPYDTDLGTLAEARIKPEHKKLELVYRLDAASDNFNGDAENLTHAIRLGSRTVPPKTNYAIGMFRESADGGACVH
jgi:DNA-directed RNA polymerase-3 subunit RPC5